MRAPGAALAALRRVHELLAGGAAPASVVVLGAQWRHARVLEHLLDVALPMGAYEVTCASEAGFAAACLEAALGAAPGSPPPPPVSLRGSASSRALLHAHAHTLPLSLYRPPNDPTRYLDELERYFRSLRRWGVEPAALEAATDANPRTGTGAAPDDAACRRELAAAYAAWVQLKDAAPVTWDTGDVVALSLRAARGPQRRALSAAVAARWRHVVVADAHDASVAAISLLTAACGGEAAACGAPDAGADAARARRRLHNRPPPRLLPRTVDVFSCPAAESRYGPTPRVAGLWAAAAAAAERAAAGGATVGAAAPETWEWRTHAVDAEVGVTRSCVSPRPGVSPTSSAQLPSQPVALPPHQLTAADLPPTAAVRGVPPGEDAIAAACAAVIDAIVRGATRAAPHAAAARRRVVVGLLARSEEHAAALAAAMRDALAEATARQSQHGRPPPPPGADLRRVRVLCDARTRLGDVSEVRLLLAALAAVAHPSDPTHAYTLAASPALYGVPPGLLAATLFAATTPAAAAGVAAVAAPAPRSSGDGGGDDDVAARPRAPPRRRADNEPVWVAGERALAAASASASASAGSDDERRAAAALHRVFADLAHCAAVFARTGSATATAAAFLRRAGLAAALSAPSPSSALHEAAADAVAATLRLLADVEGAVAGVNVGFGAADAAAAGMADDAAPRGRPGLRGGSALYAATLMPAASLRDSYGGSGGGMVMSLRDSAWAHDGADDAARRQPMPRVGLERLAFVHAQLLHEVIAGGAVGNGGGGGGWGDVCDYAAPAAAALVDGGLSSGAGGLLGAAEAAEGADAGAGVGAPARYVAAPMSAPTAAEDAPRASHVPDNAHADGGWDSPADALEAADVAAVLEAFQSRGAHAVVGDHTDTAAFAPERAASPLPPVIIVLPWRRAADAAFDDAVWAWASDAVMPGQHRPPLLWPPPSLHAAPLELRRGPSAGGAGGVDDDDDLFVPYPLSREAHVEWERHRLRLALRRVRRSATFVAPERSARHPVSSQRRSRFLDELFGRDMAGAAVARNAVATDEAIADTLGGGALSRGAATAESSVAVTALEAAAAAATAAPMSTIGVVATAPPPAPQLSQSRNGPASTPAPPPLLLSHSKLSEYAWCPHRYFLGRVVGVPRPAGVPAALLYGRAMHEGAAVMGRAVRDALAAVAADHGVGATGAPPSARVAALLAAVVAGENGGTATVLPPWRLAAAAAAALPEPSVLLPALRATYRASWEGAEDSRPPPLGGAAGRSSVVDPDDSSYDAARPHTLVPRAQARELRDFADGALAAIVHRELGDVRRHLLRLAAHSDGDARGGETHAFLSLPVLVEEPFAVDLLADAGGAVAAAAAPTTHDAAAGPLTAPAAPAASPVVRLVGIIDRVDAAPAAALLAATAAPRLRRDRAAAPAAVSAAASAAAGAAAGAAGAARLFVREYKTSRQWRLPTATASGAAARGGGVAARDLPQLATYALALSHAALGQALPWSPVPRAGDQGGGAGEWAAPACGSVRDQAVALENLEGGERAVVAVSAAAQQDTAAGVLRVAAALRAGAFEPTPSPVACALCPYQLVCAHAHGVRRAVVTGSALGTLGG